MLSCDRFPAALPMNFDITDGSSVIKKGGNYANPHGVVFQDT